jgi:hypothetical protein
VSNWRLAILEAEYALRSSAEAYGDDPDAAVERAVQVARETVLSLSTAMDRERWRLAEEWARSR